MQMLIQHWLQKDRYFKTFAVFATVVVVYFSLKPPSPESKPWNIFFLRGDLILHFCCYLVIHILYYFAFYTAQRAVLRAIVWSLLLGFVLELAQLVPYFRRVFDFQDLLANFFGVLTGTVLIRFLFPFSKEK